MPRSRKTLLLPKLSTEDPRTADDVYEQFPENDRPLTRDEILQQFYRFHREGLLHDPIRRTAQDAPRWLLNEKGSQERIKAVRLLQNPPRPRQRKKK